MAYSAKEKKQMLNDSIEIAKEKECTFIEELVSHLPIDKRTFYKWKFHENPKLKEQIAQNKVSVKAELRNKWRGSNNPTLNIALYKLLANEDERKILSDRGNSEIDVNKLLELLEAAAKVSGDNI